MLTYFKRTYNDTSYVLRDIKFSSIYTLAFTAEKLSSTQRICKLEQTRTIRVLVSGCDVLCLCQQAMEICLL